MKSKIAHIFLFSLILASGKVFCTEDSENQERMQKELQLLLQKSEENEISSIDSSENLGNYRFNPHKSLKKNAILAQDQQEDEVSLSMSAIEKKVDGANKILQEMEQMDSNKEFDDPDPMERKQEFQYRPRRKRSR